MKFPVFAFSLLFILLPNTSTAFADPPPEETYADVQRVVAGIDGNVKLEGYFYVDCLRFREIRVERADTFEEGRESAPSDSSSKEIFDLYPVVEATPGQVCRYLFIPLVFRETLKVPHSPDAESVLLRTHTESGEVIETLFWP